MQRISNIKRWPVLLTVSILPFFSNGQIDFVHPQDTLFESVNKLDSVYYMAGKEYRYDYRYSGGAVKKKVFIINDSVRVVNDYSLHAGKPYLSKEYRIVSGKVDGTTIRYYPNGMNNRVSIYRNGNRHLLYECYYRKNGTKSFEMFFNPKTFYQEKRIDYKRNGTIKSKK